MRIFDCFTYFQESFMLYIRLWRMNPYVYKFIIVTSDISHSGIPINVSFYPYEKEIMKYRDKIILKKISMKKIKKEWDKENYQRQVIYDILKSENINKKDIILVSDCDEIPTRNAMKYVINNPPTKITVFKGNLYYYNYRNINKKKWSGTILFRGDNYKDIQKARDNRDSLKSLPFDSLSHCSFCYNKISLIQKKIKSFAHTEFNKEPYYNSDYIKNRIKKHISLFFDDYFDFIDYNEEFNPLPNDNRLDYLKEEYNIIEDDINNKII